MTTYKQRKIELLPQGMYPATITKVESTLSDYGPQEKFTFDLGNGRSCSPGRAPTFTNKSKLYGGHRAPSSKANQCRKRTTSQPNILSGRRS